MGEQKVKVTYIKSAIGYDQKQKDTVRALGLRHLGDVVEQTLTPAVKGMLAKVPHLVKVEGIPS
ncbi:MAG: 50S ribosomal protein L30 [Chloroflexi bacterium]|nr:50S ribosomal protein L30 [Chloroflexota bacterium]MBI3732567.1 50S ribosomal protein L30 [Chloroflexota bacterium]